MEQTLKLQDFIDFDEFFTKLKFKIYEKNSKGILISEDLAKTFQKLNLTLD